MPSPFRLAPADEQIHENTGEANFNESMYFNFFDPAQRVGGFLRIGCRPNEGHAETTVCIYLPDGSVLFHFKRSALEGGARFDAGGARFEVLAPFERLRIGYAGSACHLRDPLSMADPRAAFAANPFEPVGIDLAIEAVGPVFGGEREGPARGAHEAEFAKGHYEQHHRASGELRLLGERRAFEGFGLRDHSWGPRSWQSPLFYRWLTANFGGELGFAATWIRNRDGSEIRGGFLHRGGRLVPVRGVAIEADFAGEQQLHRGLRVRLECTDGGTLDVVGRVIGMIPLRNRRDGRVTRIAEGMTEWSCEGRTGFGLSEFLDQIG